MGQRPNPAGVMPRSRVDRSGPRRRSIGALALWAATALPGVACGDPALSGSGSSGTPDLWVAADGGQQQDGAASDVPGGLSTDSVGETAGESGDGHNDASPDAVGCVPQCQGVVPRITATRYPIVLAHGAGGWDNVGPLEYWWRVAEHLGENGFGAYTAQVDPFNATSVRAQQLAAFVDAVLACNCASKVNLIGHSQGGLDARYLVSSLGYGDRVASVTTISSPHRGTEVADAVWDLMNDKWVPGFTNDLVNFVLFFVGGALNDPFADPNFQAQIATMTTWGMVDFNAENADDARVAYFSWAGRAGFTATGNEVCAAGEVPNPDNSNPMFGLMVPLWTLMGGLEGVANDGLVRVSSAQWGRFRGCVPADHLAEIGHPLSFTSGFEHRAFYLDIARFVEDEGH